MERRITGRITKEYNPSWPPKLGSLIVMEHPQYINNLFIGTVHQLLEGNTASIIMLVNNKHYREIILEKRHILRKGESDSVALLFPTYGWRYVDLEKYNKLFGNKINLQLQPRMTNVPFTQQDLTNESIYSDPSIEKGQKCNGDDQFRDTSLLNEKGDLQLNDLFKEKEVNQSIFDPQDQFEPLDEEIRRALKQKLEIAETIPDSDKKIIVNKTVAIKNMIDSKEDEINEGRKIVAWLIENMVNKETDGIKIFGDLKMSIFNGYVHLARKGINVDDVITPELVPDLKFFKWQYNIPVDYDALKYLLFQSDFQSKIASNIEQQKEAEKIFSQEYIISLQPEPQYQIWALRRLIMAWYADDDLQFHIRKIKILINQWRSRSDQEFNRQYGTLPSIVILPRYGKNSAKLVLSKISHYFLLYQNIGWSCSNPSYFIKVNDLIWYTNGSIDLKLYFRKASQSYGEKVKNRSFDEYFTGLLSAEKLLHSA